MEKNRISLLGIQSKLKLFLGGMGDRGKFFDATKAFSQRFPLKHCCGGDCDILMPSDRWGEMDEIISPRA